MKSDVTYTAAKQRLDELASRHSDAVIRRLTHNLKTGIVAIVLTERLLTRQQEYDAGQADVWVGRLKPERRELPFAMTISGEQVIACVSLPSGCCELGFKMAFDGQMQWLSRILDELSLRPDVVLRHPACGMKRDHQEWFAAELTLASFGLQRHELPDLAW